MQQKRGLSSLEAKKRLSKYGRNEIKKQVRAKGLKIFISQFTSPLILLLIVVAVISWVIGFLPNQDSNIIDTILILVIVFASGLSGFFQDYKAEKTIEALQKIATPKTRIIRDGKEIKINITEIVPGDLVLLEEGDVIPADCKLVEAFNLEVDESTLTGESKAVNKKINDDVFKGTFVNSGNAKALITKTGMQTKIGKIAGKLQEIKEEKTLFETEIAKFSKKIFFIIIGIVVLLFLISILKYSFYQSVLISISLAVAAIPEGLPAVLVLVLAIGARVMANKNALVRKLNVVESSGAVDVVCTDKTGTLTKNEMSVTKIFFNNKIFDVSKINEKNSKEVNNLLICGGVCNNSKTGYNNKNEKIYLGDQTEIALKKIANKFFKKETKKYKKIEEISFTSDRKMMSVICKKNQEYLMFSKGASEVLIEKCDRIYQNGKIINMNDRIKKEILEQNKKFASQALRILGFAYKEISEKEKNLEKNLIWLGLQAMIDPPKKEVKQALKDCKTAGIRVIMLTGDNPLTAKSIADEIELESKGVMVGKELDKLSNKELEKKLESVNIFARISPFHKLRILEILKKKYRVAMTGDGVNDALALKKADVGIAVGKGTEVAKQASDIILLDNNFASIVSTVKEGRRAFDNIRKFINYLFVCNVAEVGVLFLATLFLTLKEPILLPVQILWINLLTDGFPALALGVDPARPDIMEKPPRKKKETIINKRLAWLIGTIGIKMMILLFATFFLVLFISGMEQARTALFTGFILYELVRIGSIRYQEKLSWFANKWLLAALFGSVLLQLLIVYTPLGKFFHIVPLGIYAWLVLIAGIVVGYILAILITKIVIKFVED